MTAVIGWHCVCLGGHKLRGQELYGGIFNPSVSHSRAQQRLPPAQPRVAVGQAGIRGRHLCRLLQREQEAHPVPQMPSGAKRHMDMGLSYMPGNAETQSPHLSSGGASTLTGSVM